MDTRRFRNDSSQRFAEFRWWGCVLLAMFSLVQTARGSVGPTAPPEPVRPDNTRLPVASAACQPTTHVVAFDAAFAAAAWDEAAMLISDPLQDPLNVLGSTRPIGAKRMVSAARNVADAGASQIQTR